ncbi:hypothetical protein LINPERPRIM_LOCUS29361 [Linum perenne]
MDVPAELITPEGISWIATQFGKPVNKFVRLGFMIKVCVLRKPGLDDVSELKIDMGDDDPAVVKVSFLAGRSYKGERQAKNWVARQKNDAASASTAGNEAEPSMEGEDSPESSTSPPVGGGSGNASESPKGEKVAPGHQENTESFEEVVILSPEIESRKKRKKRKSKGKT